MLQAHSKHKRRREPRRGDESLQEWMGVYTRMEAYKSGWELTRGDGSIQDNISETIWCIFISFKLIIIIMET